MVTELVSANSGGHHYVIITFVADIRGHTLFKGAGMFLVAHIKLGKSAAGATLNELHLQPQFLQKTVGRYSRLRINGVDITRNKNPIFILRQSSTTIFRYGLIVATKIHTKLFLIFSAKIIASALWTLFNGIQDTSWEVRGWRGEERQVSEGAEEGRRGLAVKDVFCIFVTAF